MINWKKTTALTIFFSLQVLALVLVKPTQATELSITTGSDWQSGTNTGVWSQAKEGELELSPAGSWGAQSWKTPDKTIGIGSAFASDGERIYVFRGVGDVAFWRYTPTTDSWETLPNAPRGIYYGADLQYHNGYIYALFGGYQKEFARYSIANNSWEMMAEFPSFVWYGGSLTSDGTYLYGIPGNTTQEFYRYDPSTNTWQSRAQAPNTLVNGAELTHINGYIYTPRGAGTASFYRYNIADNNWVTLTNLPTTINDSIDNTTDGVDLYVSRQQGTNSFYRYNVASDTWDNLTNAPYTAQYAGVQYLSSDGMIYFFRGTNDYRFWKYDPKKAIVSATAIQSDGQILIGGSFTQYDGVAQTNIARLNSNGTLDNSFDQGTGPNGTIASIVLQTDGKILIAGNFTSYNGTTRNRIARINSDGSLDTSFDPGSGPNGYIQSLKVQTDGKIILVGSFTEYNTTDRNRIARINSDGSLDTGFDPGTGASEIINAVAIQSDGKIVIGGNFTTFNGAARNRIARLSAAGALEATATFNPAAGANDIVHTLAIQTDGKIVIGGAFTTYVGTARARVARVNTNGTNDTTFVPGAAANDTVHSLAIQTDGKIVIRGYFTTYTGTLRNRIARLTNTGGLDATFDPSTGVNNTIHSIAIQSDNSVVIGGSFTTVSGTARNHIARVTTSGALDSNFALGTAADISIGTATKDTFAGPTEALATLGVGSDMLTYNNELYVTRGINTTTFYKYTPGTNIWTTLTPAPGTFNDDTTGTVANGLLYFLRGSNSASFYSYDPVANTWDITLPNAPSTVSYGGSLYYPGSGDYLYATRGVGTTTFWRYTISTKTWEQSVGGVPIQNLPNEVLISYGSRMVGSGNDIFVTTGSGVKRLFKYSISANTWTEQAAPPFSSLWGTDLVFANGVITAMAGFYENDMYEYNPTLNTWRKLNSLPGYGPTNFGPYQGAAIAYVPATSSYFVTRGGSRQEMLVYSPGLTNFDAIGSWTSASLDLQHVATWNALSVTKTTPGDSAITLATQSSADGLTWSGWQTVSGTSIASPTNRYLQIKATLNATSTLAQTPILQSLTVDYTTDSTPPTNPSTFTGSSTQVSGEPLTSELSYRHLTPYFTWTSATDAQSNIAGYYVYFGPNASANPVDQGTFQTTIGYQANGALETGTYYLRIASKNTVGLTSSPITGFIYDYIGISPSLKLSQTTTANFSGTATHTTTTGDKLQLEGLASGFWTSERLALINTAVQFSGSTTAYDPTTNRIYLFAGANNLLFRAYDIASNTWINLADAPGGVYYGGGVVLGPPGYLYGLRGGTYTDFWLYNISLNTWTTVTSAPLTISYGASMVFDGERFIYVTRGNNTNTFWRYDTTTDEWSTLAGAEFGAPTDNVTNAIHRSADLTIDLNHNLIYATQGNYFQGFSVYNINTARWTVLPDTPTLVYDGSALEYDPDLNRVYYTAGNTTDYFYYYDVDAQEWHQLNSAPSTLLYGAGINKVGNNLYVIKGGATSNFYKYNITKNSWLLPNRGLFSRVFDGAIGSQGVTNTGADILKGDGHNYYLTRGNYADDFLRWNEETGEVTQLANTPNGVMTGSSMVYDGNANQIYFTAGSTDRGFFSYSIANNIWTKITTDPLPVIANVGSSMVYDGTRYIYLSQGNSNIFRRYDQLADPTTRWSVLPTITAAISNGAELVLKDGYIYTMRGGNNPNNPLYRYTIGGSWQAMAPLTGFTVHNDGFLVDGNDGYLYLGRAINTSDYFRYSISGNTWEQIAAMPAQVNTGGTAESNLLNKIYMMPGPGTDTYGDALYTYVLKTPTSGFVDTGEYISPSHNLTNVYKWANLEVTQTVPDNTELLISTRTSANNSTWSDWVATSQPKAVGTIYRYKINSPTAQYIQIKFTLNSPNQVTTPIIDDYAINYYQDFLAPSNPQSVSPALNGFKAYVDASKSATLNFCTYDTCPGEITNPDEWYWKNDWYNHPAPYFEWPAAELPFGASDTATGSGVLGYHVYFGTNAAADPEVDGDFQTNAHYTPSTLSNNSIHYLRIKTVDEAGNVSPTSWQPYSYRYDLEGATAPANVIADPAGYSANPLFTFNWEAATSSGALVTHYCYKTATTSGIFASDQCIAQTELAVSNIPSYKVGQNTFSVRAKDEANNYSNYSTVSYYYADAANAPAPPTGLQVTPTSNTTNSFAFSWSIPDVFLGAAANLKYRYSINPKNAILTAQNTFETSLTYLNAGSFANQPDENTFYIVAQDEAGNINYNNYASVVFTSNTAAPGIPTNMEITDSSTKSKSKWKLTISWDKPETGGNDVTSYKVYRSLDGVTFSLIATTGGTEVGGSYQDADLKQVIYYYKVSACDNTNNCGVESTVVSLLPDGRFTEAAELVAEPVVSGITTKKATVTWTTARTADSKIAFGTESGKYSDSEVASSEQVANHVLNLINLSPGIKYYYIAKWTDEDGNLGVSEENSFETLPPPSTQEPKAKQIGLTTALIEFTSKNSEKIKIYYGETPTFGGVKEVSTGTGEGKYTVELEELKDGTKYFYKINAFDIDGAEYEGEMHSFTTLPRPKVTDISITQVQGTAQTTLLLRWKSNTAISSIVTYFPTGSPQLAKDEVNIALKNGNHQMILFNLEPQTPYSVLIRGKDVAGNEATSAVQQVLTSADTRPPQILEIKVDSEITGVGEEATVQLLVSYKTDEKATSQVEYGEGTGTTYGQKTQEDGTQVIQHLVVISGLSPGKVYHLRALSKDEFGNVGESIDKVVVTPKATESALDLVITNLTSVFSFIQTK